MAGSKKQDLGYPGYGEIVEPACGEILGGKALFLRCFARRRLVFRTVGALEFTVFWGVEIGLR